MCCYLVSIVIVDATVIERSIFGRTNHHSSRVIFGAAALGAMSERKAEETLSQVNNLGLNHVDVAASYGDAELRLKPWLVENREHVFLATKTGHRDGDGARRQLEESLVRMGVDSVDLIQLHNLTDQEGWERAMKSGGALEGLVRAKEEGLVRFIGVTGHGTYAPEMHIRSLSEYDFDSVLVPYNYLMMTNATYSEDFGRLRLLCNQRSVAIQTIKSVAARRWQKGDDAKRFSWYRPISCPNAIKRAVDFVMRESDLFLNSSSDAGLLKVTVDAAGSPIEKLDKELFEADIQEHGMEPLFVRGVSDDVFVAETS